ncbi:MAG: acyl-protein synthetase, partial [Clostridiales bacterium]|nr:acyl-protein synthetase [Clostridiales bacterium]
MPHDKQAGAVGIDGLIDCAQFSIPQAEKEKALVEIFRPQLAQNRFCASVDSMYGKLGFCEAEFSRLAEIPFIPVSMFKMFDLVTCERSQIVRVLRSSATTTGTPSRVYLDKETAFRQSKALTAILKSYLGTSRRPFLVIDCPSAVGRDQSMSARGAAIMGVSVFARGAHYAFRDDMTLDMDSIEAFCAAARGGGDCLAFGFTYIIWTKFLPALKSAGLSLALPRVSALHSGGWKKLASESVDKAAFSDGVARALGTGPERVLDFYGMAEQTGVVFIDCECGNKHAPCFADIAIRDFLTLAEVEPGGEGLIEVMSALPTSYPGQAVLTEDVGVFLGV